MFDVYHETTAAQDVWAFAMTALVTFSPICARRLVAEFLQELCTREDPFHPISGTASIVMRILKGPPDRPSAENTYFPFTDEWWGIFSECWHSKPLSRPTMFQVANKIEQTVRSSPDLRLSVIN